MTKEELERMLLVDHLTLAEIASLNGCTRQNVFYHVKKFGIDTSTAERFLVTCDTCKGQFETTRKRWKSSIKHFCCASCYTDYLRNDEYVQSRTGQRVARIVLNESGKHLPEGCVVHHIDGNNMNNDLSNLMVFKSNSEHIKHHHELRRKRMEGVI